MYISFEIRWRLSACISLSPFQKATWEYPNVQLGHIDTTVWFLFSGLFISSTLFPFFLHRFPYMVIKHIECSSRKAVSSLEYWSCVFHLCWLPTNLHIKWIHIYKYTMIKTYSEWEKYIRGREKDEKHWKNIDVRKQIGPTVKSLPTQSNSQIRNICSCQ